MSSFGRDSSEQTWQTVRVSWKRGVYHRIVEISLLVQVYIKEALIVIQACATPGMQNFKYILY